MSIARVSVKNPVLVNILMFAVLALGFFSLTRLPREQFSEVPLFFVNVIVPYPGVSAEDVETSVTVPIENAMAGIDSLRSIRSTTREGLSTVTLQFDDGLSNDRFERLFQQVQTRFTTVALPSGTLPASIADFSSNDFLPVIEVVLSGDVPFAVLDSTARSLASRIEARNDVSGVDQIGVRDRRIMVSVDQGRLVALGIPVSEVSRAIQGRNVTIPGGTIASQGNEFLLRTVGGIERVDELERIVVRRTPDGIVRLGDVATVAMEFENAGVVSRFNGESSLSLRVNKVPRGNSIGVIDAVREEIAFLSLSGETGIQFTLTNDSTVQIRDSINVLLTNAIMGLGLLIVILFLFIGLRNALITAIGIPVTFAATFVVLELLGETFNSNTLFGMVLVLGLVVDHSIVIVENSYRRQQLGLSRHRAAIEGANEVIVPVFAATATTVAAFLPLTLLPGVIGLFLRVVPLTVSIALILSTLEAAFFLPSHYADWPGGNTEPKRAFFDVIRNGFGRVIARLYRFRAVTVAGIVVVMIGVFSLVPFIQQDLFSAEDFTLFFIEIELPAGSSRDRTNAVVARYEDRLLPLVGNGEIVSINSTVGFSQRDNETIRRNNVAQIVVDLAERTEGRERSITEVVTAVQDLTFDIPGAEAVQFRRAINGPPTDSAVSFRFFGDSFEELSVVAGAVRDRLTARPDLINVEDNLDPGTPELRIIVDEERAMQLGLSTQTIGSFIRTAFDGLPVSTVFLDNEQYDVIVTYAGLSTLDASAVTQLSIPTPDGRFVPFSTVARIDDSEAPASIKRFDGRREVTITADALSTANLGELNRDIEEFFAEEFGPVFPGMTLRIGGDFAEIANLLIEILRIFLIGVLLIYLILGAQFKSYTQPLLVLLSVPFAFVGVVLFLAVSGTPLSTTVIYASVALAGIAVNDTIVLVSFVNERRMSGASVVAAVVEGATTRLRPILLTSITTISGLLPTAIGLGGRSVIWGPMASTIIFALVFSTITALVVVPCIYGLLFDTKRSQARFEKRRRLAAETDNSEVASGALAEGYTT